MNYYKLTDLGGIERFSGRILHHDGRVYVNPTEEVLRSAGYKPLLKDPVPEDAGAPDAEEVPIVYRSVYRDEGDSIRESYERGDYRDEV